MGPGPWDPVDEVDGETGEMRHAGLASMVKEYCSRWQLKIFWNFHHDFWGDDQIQFDG